MRVLLADDQALLCSAIRLLLEEEEEFNIEIVGEISEAKCLESAIKTLHPTLLLLDWELPGLKTMRERRQLIHQLRTIQTRLYIIFLIGSPELNGNPLAIGADAVVSKANPPEHFLQVIHQAIQCLEPAPSISMG